MSPAFRSLLGYLTRWSLCVLLPWAAMLGLHLDATRLGEWSLWPLSVAYRLGEIATAPFTPVAGFSVDLIDGQYAPLHYVVRFGAAALVYGTALSLVWQTFSMARARPRAGAATGATRRQFVARAGLAAVGIAGAGCAVWPTGVAPYRLAVRRYEVPIPDLPPDLDGLRLVHLSDTHFGPYNPLSLIRRAVEMANDEGADLAVLTGDYVHRTPRAFERGIGVFTELRTRHGAVAVLGNHDHWEGADACRRRFAELDLPLLDNDRLWLTPEGLRDTEDPGRSLALVGVAEFVEDTPDPHRASRGISAGCPRVLLCHNPDGAEVFPTKGGPLRVDLQLSGHTHGGQVCRPGGEPLIIPGESGFKYAGGLVQGPGWPVIVSRGVGMTIAPVRYAARPEVGVITLRRGSGPAARRSGRPGPVCGVCVA